MIQRSLGYMGLSQDYGSAHNVVKMRPNGAVPSGEYGGMWDYLTDKDYREDYKNAKEAEMSRSDAQEWAESAKENRELYEQSERDMQYIRDFDTSSMDTRPAQLEYRDAPGAGEYLYRQFSNGDIAIMQGAPPPGWSLGKVGPRDGAWKAITDEIGPYPTGTVDKVVSDVQSGARKIFDQLVGGASAVADARVAGEQKSDNTALYVVAGVGGVLVLGLLGLALSRRGGN